MPMPTPGSFKQMFPKYFLDAEDLPQDKITEVEIVCIQLSSFGVRQQRGPKGPSAQMENPEWEMWTREFDKPLRFKRHHGQSLERLFGTDKPEAVKSMRIGIYPGEREIYGEMKPAILIHPIRVGQVRPLLGGVAREIEPAASATRTLPLDLANKQPIGKANADKLKQALAEQALTFDGLLRWMKAANLAAWELATGKALEDLPRGIAPLLQQYLREAPAAPKEPEPSADKPIDFKAGLPGSAKPAESEPIDEDDIPF